MTTFEKLPTDFKETNLIGSVFDNIEKFVSG